MDFLHLSHRPGQLPSTQLWFSVCKTETSQTQNSDFHPLRGGSIKLGTTTSLFLHALFLSNFERVNIFQYFQKTLTEIMHVLLDRSIKLKSIGYV